MHMKQKALTRALAAVGIACAASPAFAQQTPPPAKVEKIEVTGSNIKRVDTETASPIQVITADDIAKSGATSVAEVLRSIPAASAGALQDFDSGTGFAAGAQSVSLRGLGSQATLVLVNGRRLAPAAYADPNAGQSVIYNLNAIPVSAIERIDILKDGASAIYGSEAMAGVINIILRKDFQGAVASVNGSQNGRDNFKNYTASATLGFGDLSKNRYNALVNVEHYKRERTGIREVDNVQNSTYDLLYGRLGVLSSRSYPPNYRREATEGSGVFNRSIGPDPRCPANLVIGGLCRYDQWNNLAAQSDTERNGVLGRLTFEITPTLTAYAEAAYSKVETEFLSSPFLADEFTTTWFAQDGRQFRYDGFILPVGHPDNPNPFRVLLRYRFADLGVSKELVTNETTRALFGLSGTVANWDWESAILYNKSEREDRYNGFPVFSELVAAQNNGTYRPFGNNDPALLARINPFITDRGEATTTMVDLKGSRELFAAAGGPAMVAAGAEYRREELSVTPDSRIVNGEFIGLGGSQVNGSRNVTSAYGELSIPLARNVETQFALRHDRYSDYGSSTTPKIGVKWTPTRSLALRSTYAGGFRAPSISQITQSNVQVFNTIADPVRCDQPESDDADCTGRSISSLIRANQDLQPEESKGFTLGFIFAPTDNLNLSADFYQIRREDEVGRFSSQYIINREDEFPGQVIRDPNPATWIPGIPNSGPILSTIRRFQNLGESRTSGVDVDASYRMPLGGAGKVTATVQATYLLSYKNSFTKGDPLIEYAGDYGPVGELPRFKGNASLNWEYQNWSALARVNYVGGWKYGDRENGCYDPLFEDFDAGCYVKSWHTLDLGVTYRGIRNLTIAGIVRNVNDKAAPFDPDNTSLGFNPSFHNPYGRYFNVALTYKFK
jgi:iron complex outermembrane receptor protein